VLRAIADWKTGTSLKYGLTTSVVESAQKATIFGVHLGDSLLFSHKHVPLHVGIVIFLTVAVSATTTFMTVRQSSKRGLMNANVDPDNPMAQSQKYMMYIVPFFSLTGLYWQYGLVMYWVTTNLWTLGQQYFMFRNWEVVPTGAAAATAAATTGTSVRTTQNSLRSGSGAAKPSGSGGAKTPADGRRSASGGAKTPAGARTGSTSARPAASGNGSARTGNGSSGVANGSGGARTGAARRPATVTTTPVQPPVQPPVLAAGEKRGLLRLGRQKQEPAPEPEAPTVRVVRQQPVRQAKGKRSGNKR
jgi:YidC/Oxa1 family membrane protein insertase